MNRFHPFRRVLAPILALALAFTLSLPASAFFWNKKESARCQRLLQKRAYRHHHLLLSGGLRGHRR